MGRLMRQYAIPCIISLLVGALYNIVDQIFIANASYLGSYGNAANTVVFPLTVVALAIAVMVGDGCCAFVSMALGRSEIGKAKRSVGNAVVLSVAGGLVLTVVYLVFAEQHHRHVRRHGQRGNLPLFAGIFLLYHARHPVLYVRAGDEPDHPRRRQPEIRHGLHRWPARSSTSSSIPIFIFGFKWGMMGAAVATVIGQVADGRARRLVSAAHEDHQARVRRLYPAREHLRADR